MTVKLAFSRPTATADEQHLLFARYLSAGYEGLQLKYGQYASYLDDPERFKEEWGHLRGVGSGLIAAGLLDERNIEQLRSVFRFAGKVGTDTVIFCHGVPRKEVAPEHIRKFAAVLSELGKEAQQHGVRLSLHHHYNQPVMYREDFDLFFESVKDQAVGLTVDTAHLIKSGIGDAAEVITSFREVINNFHIKDYADGEWRILGRGHIDFGPIFQAIRQTGYDGWISADEESGGNIIGGMAECLSYLKKGLDLV